ncbi:sensor histidine kinase [Halobellus captivus]|uniref:sensor histidine kinase n=1 Tax=Halobellus captivus TaxID=2592614 RepID=UPI0011A0DCAC|nr:ATP-binding protein [Halobellus captivus]
MLPLSSQSALYGAYVFAFAAAAIVCFATVSRTRQIEDEDTRDGLRWLLLTSGGWAAAHVGYLTLPTVGLRYGAYVIGLVVGIASVGPWLYFCSAYTGRSIHRNPTVRRAFVAVFIVIIAVKLTNPIHNWYFVAESATTPFAYLEMRHRAFHWVAMGLAYALAFVGFFMLFELFTRVNSDTRPLFVLIGLTAIPVLLDVAGAVSPYVLDITYSSIGVAAFSVGVFSLYFDQFQFVRVAGETTDPIIVVDESGDLRDYNRRAAELFPALSNALDEPLGELTPELLDAVDDPESILEIEDGDTTRYYNVSSNPFTTGSAQTGRSIVLTDVTHREQYRKELESKNEKLEQFASIVSHDLRNPLQVAKGRVELAIDEDEIEHLEPVVRAHRRMEQLIEEMLTLAREGVAIDETEPVDIGVLAERSWGMIASKEASFSVDTEAGLRVIADPERLQQLFENLFRNAVEHGGGDVTVTVGPLDDGPGFYVEDDGPGIPADEREQIFEAGYTTSTDGTGFGLAIVSEIVDAHGWEIRAAEGTDGGARFEVRTD